MDEKCRDDDSEESADDDGHTEKTFTYSIDMCGQELRFSQSHANNNTKRYEP